MARIYLASSWRNLRQPEVVEVLRDAGHAVYDFRKPPHGEAGFAWSDISHEWQSWTPWDYRNLIQTHPIAARGFMSDKRGMEWADTCIMLLPCGRSAHLECGWMAGAGKRTIILMEEKEEPELMNLLATDICINLEEVLEALV